MKNFLFSLVILLGLSQASLADEDKIAAAVKVQGTVVGSKIVPAAILDDIIVREGDVCLVNEDGNLVVKLGSKEIADHDKAVLVKIVSITHGNVVLQHQDVNLSISAR